MTLNSPPSLVISGHASVLLNSEMDAWKYTISTYYHVHCVCLVYTTHIFQCHLCLQELIVVQTLCLWDLFPLPFIPCYLNHSLTMIHHLCSSCTAHCVATLLLYFMYSMFVAYNSCLYTILSVFIWVFSHVELSHLVLCGFSPGLCRVSTDLNQLLHDTSLAPGIIQL